MCPGLESLFLRSRCLLRCQFCLWLAKLIGQKGSICRMHIKFPMNWDKKSVEKCALFAMAFLLSFGRGRSGFTNLEI